MPWGRPVGTPWRWHPSSLDGADLLQDAELVGGPPPLDHLAVDEATDLHAANPDGFSGRLVAVGVALVRGGDGDAAPVRDELLRLDMNAAIDGPSVKARIDSPLDTLA